MWVDNGKRKRTAWKAKFSFQAVKLFGTEATGPVVEGLCVEDDRREGNENKIKGNNRHTLINAKEELTIFARSLSFPFEVG